MVAGKRPLVCVGVPCYGAVQPEFLEDFARFLFHLGRRMPDVDFCTAIRTKTEQFRARNAIVDAAQSAGADYLLMLDDDMIVNPFQTCGPTEEYQFLEKLLAHDKDIIGALYYQRTGSCLPVLMAAAPGGGYRFLHDDEITHGLQRVDVAGGGCLLIKMTVFGRIAPPYFQPEFLYGTDIQLCKAAAEKGYEVWADTSIELGHLRQEQTIVTSRNRHQFVLESGLPGEVRRSFVTSDVYDRLIADACAYTQMPSLDHLLGQTDVSGFLQGREASGLSDLEWYQRFPQQRIARQIWFNTQNADKKRMTEFILASVDPRQPFDILDFGCGIGIPAFTFADKGHRVTACDLVGTGTFEFLQWRVARHRLPMTFYQSHGGAPHLGDAQFDVIVAMDSLEHIKDWRIVLRELAGHLRPTGVLFCNNGVLLDNEHPEHYPLANKDFLQACLELDLMPVNQITFVKRDLALPDGARGRSLAHA